MLTPHCSAASGMVVPSSIVPTTRLRRSSEYGFAIHAGLLPADSLNHIRLAMGIPRFSLLGKRSSTAAKVIGLSLAPATQGRTARVRKEITMSQDHNYLNHARSECRTQDAEF